MAKDKTKYKFLFVLFVFFISLSGCAFLASLASKGLLPEVKARRPPEVDLGEELALLDDPATACSSFISQDGRVHLFAIDNKAQLYHIEILGDTIVTREALGVINTERGFSIDAVEYPDGVLRVLAGDRQYIRSSPAENWREMKGNRCMKFLPAGDNLFCAFVAKGDEEIGAPKRTDITYGWFILIPIVYWSHEQAAKLVLAQELEGGWAIRAVLDPDTDLDADRDFMVGIDNQGIIHFLYNTSRGGGVFVVIAHPAGGGAGYQGHEPLLRYSQISLDRILHFATPTQKAPDANQHPRGWLPIKGFPMSKLPPYVKSGGNSRLRNFEINNSSCELQGLMHMVGYLKDGDRELQFSPSDQAWLRIGLRDGHWAKNVDIVTATDLPEQSYSWSIDPDVIIRNNSQNYTYALIRSTKNGKFFMTCFVKNYQYWSAPLVIGSTRFKIGDGRSIAVDEYGRAFAAWVDGEGRFVGRWLTSHQS